MSVLIVGSIALDDIKTQLAEHKNLLGGSASYGAVSASNFSPVNLVGIVGDDFPAEHIGLFKSRGINLAGLQSVPGKTFRWSGEYMWDMNTRETRSVALNVFEHFTPKLPPGYESTPLVLLANIAPDLQHHVLDQVRQPRFTIADTMDLWINIAREELLALFREIDGVVLNDQEAMQLTGRSNAISAARAVLEFGLTFVIVKKGEHGAVLVHRDGVATIPAFPADERHVIDPTGAGDSFAGGLMGHLASVGTAAGGVDFAAIQAALAWGTVLASFTIESFSLDRLRRLDRSQIDERLRTFRQLARIG
jgi:sugar/nucleoside kinase (ribokinase family)